MPFNSTIVAISTPPGRGGIGIVRMSGSNALAYARRITTDQAFCPTPNRSYLKNFHDPTTCDVVDKGLLTYFKAPRSFTGEDVVELSCHGSPIVLLRIVDVLLHLGAHAASPGEFTMRALANKRLNLSQAEAIRDLINAQTSLSATQAIRQLNGELSSRLQPLKESLLSIIVPLESALEFVEEDIPQVFSQNTKKQICNLIIKTEALASTYKLGRTLKDGYKVALVGRPNVGKSSIFNTLLAYERSIVTNVPGTTRDSVTEHINLNDVPVLLTDTAGIRSSEDEVEQLGIERTKRAVADADLTVAIFDGSAELTAEDHQVLSTIDPHKHLIVINKADVLETQQVGEYLMRFSSSLLRVSAKTSAGFDLLRNAILSSLDGHAEVFEGNYLITNPRHYDLLRCTIDSLSSSLILCEQQASEEIVLVGLYNALRYLGDITGETTSENVLSEIFATFCIGK